MYLAALDIDGRERPGGAIIFAGAAAEATVLVDSGNHRRSDGGGVLRDDVDGGGGAMARAGVARDAIAIGETVVEEDDGEADADGRLGSRIDRRDSGGGADVRATRTGGRTQTVGIVDVRLEKRRERGGGFEDV